MKKLEQFKQLIFKESLMRLVGYVSEAVASSAFAFLIILLAARSVGQAEFGQFAFVLAIAGLQAPLAAFGFTTLIYGRAAARPNTSKRVIGSAIAFAASSGLTLYLFTLLGFIVFSSESSSLLYAGAGLRLAAAVGTLLINDAMARHALSEYLPVRLMILVIAAAAATVTYFAGLPLYVLSVIWGMEALCFAVAIMLMQFDRRAKLDRRNRYTPLVIKAAPFALQSIFVTIYLRFDQIYVGWRFGQDALSLYAIGARVAELGNVGFNALTLAISPLVIEQLRTAGKIGSGALVFLSALALITFFTSLGAFFSGEVVLAVVFGAAYSDADTILAVYMLSICFVAYGSIASRVLAAQGIGWPQARSGALGAVSNVGLSIVLGEILGLEGVALATVLSYALVAAVIWRSAILQTRMSRY